MTISVAGGGGVARHVAAQTNEEEQRGWGGQLGGVQFLNFFDFVQASFSALNSASIPGIRPLNSHSHFSCFEPAGKRPERMIPSAAIENVIFATSDKGCLHPYPHVPS